MQAHHLVAASAKENQAFALMSRLHVALRRQTQRIIDIEYMRMSPDYCRHVLDLAAQSTLPDIHELGIKIEDLYFGANGLFVAPSAKPAADVADHDQTAQHASATPPHDAVAVDSQPKAGYVGRLR
jgi:hypothetical protein